MSCKWIFGLVGLYISGGRGFLFGFFFGWFIDSLFHRPVIRFTFRHGTEDSSSRDYRYWQQQSGQTWQPYVDVTLEEAYRTLGIPDTATDDEVRQAYRQMALRYHPDRVAAQGEAARREAEENFQRVTEARDIIMRARGIQ